MTTLSRDQIATYAKGAGFTGGDVDIAVAVAMAESGGDPHSHNSTPPDDSYGLWQINMLGSLGPARRKEFGLQNNDELFDPVINARAANTIYKRSGWKAWTTYTSGKYKTFLKGGTPVEASMTEPNKNPLDVGTSIGSAINSFGETLLKTGADIGGLLVALVFIVLGIVLLARKQITNVIPAGKAVKALKAVS